MQVILLNFCISPHYFQASLREILCPDIVLHADLITRPWRQSATRRVSGTAVFWTDQATHGLFQMTTPHCWATHSEKNIDCNVVTCKEEGIAKRLFYTKLIIFLLACKKKGSYSKVLPSQQKISFETRNAANQFSHGQLLNWISINLSSLGNSEMCT